MLQRKYLLNRPGESMVFFSSESFHTTPMASFVQNDVANARVVPKWASPGCGRLCTLQRFDCFVAAKLPTKSPWRKYGISSPLSRITPHRAHPSSAMTWGTRALRQNGRPPAVGGGRSLGRQRPWSVDDGKNQYCMIATVCEKKSQKRGVTLWRESAYDSSGNDLRTRLCVLWLHIVYVDHTT